MFFAAKVVKTIFDKAHKLLKYTSLDFALMKRLKNVLQEITRGKIIDYTDTQEKKSNTIHAIYDIRSNFAS